MNLMASIIKKIKEQLNQDKNINEYKTSPQYFQRKRLLPLDKIVILILRGQKLPFQNALTKFFKEMGKVRDLPTASAYCQARQKLKPELFKNLNDISIESFYSVISKVKYVKCWNFRRLLAIDGSIINLPDTPETRKKYSIQINQYDERGKVQGLLSCLYDILNDLTINASLKEKRAEKKFLFEDHYNYLNKGDIIVLDRAYADFSIISFLNSKEINFVIRTSKNSFKMAKTLSNSRSSDPIGGGITDDIRVELEQTPKQKKFIREESLQEEVNTRFIRLVLPNGDVEILITNLLDEQEFPASDIGNIYKLRWCVETFFDRLKNIFEVQRFSAKRLNSILQDFHGIIFLTTLESLLSKIAEEELVNMCQEVDRKYSYKINHSVSLSVLLDHLVDLFFNKNRTLLELLNEVSFLFKKNPVIVRKNRINLRGNLINSQKLWFWKYKKKVIA